MVLWKLSTLRALSAYTTSLSTLLAPRRLPLRLMLRNPNAALPAPLRPCRLSLEQDKHPSYLILIDDCSPMPISSLIPAACRQLTGASGMPCCSSPQAGCCTSYSTSLSATHMAIWHHLLV